ncbi:hypothetical protein [Nodularia sphaerocarpa]|uniref:hypothetical protein n=1 Tax=Nodularia sphaerocarpa TaxID=137816 RepID=UPI001EFB450B|nr:hypothetical protein [Nodularia sphaerocarpa]MDB9374307.1 hypothetical protein [Nodularia sphaerocarpa CS-585]MDB9376463.1 hypothetical protein [Nodularia sphaerocarpa CS-585A2]ULP74143.1 hypothetical protein BDGGKGIB_03806 [Nodularia sphaerocarpa UHCC 0038]
MASPLPAGLIKSTNKPAGLLEISLLLQQDELALPEDTRPDNISVSFDTDAGIATVSASLPITFALSAQGEFVATGVEYL